MAANPYEPQFEYGPDGRPIRRLPSRIPSGAPTLGVAAPAQPQSLTPIDAPAPSRLEALAPTPVVRDLRGGFVGASTDAQAAKALQDRAEQSSAAQFNIDSMNRGAEAERDLRAARLGVSRGVLDRMEGRNDTAAAAADSAAQGAIPDRWDNPLSLPGDSFQATRGRQAEYDRAVDQALNGNPRQQKGAQAALQGLMGLVEQNRAGERLAAEREIARTKSLDDLSVAGLNAETELAKSRQLTPFQAGTLALSADKNRIDEMRERAARDQQRATGLAKFATGLSDDPRYSSFQKARPFMGMLEEQYRSDNPADKARLPLTLQQLSRPESEPNDFTIKRLEEGTGDLVDRVFGPVKQALGGSRYSRDQQDRLYRSAQGSFDAKERDAAAAVNDVVQRVRAAGGDPGSALSPSDMDLWAKHYASGGPTGVGPAQYRYDPEKGLVPIR